MIKAVIFDVDGVILNTVPYHFKAWKRMFSEQGIDFSFDDYLLKVNGVPRITGIKNIIKNASKNLISSLAQKKQLYFEELISQRPPKVLTGVIPLLKQLKKEKITTAAASSSKNIPYLLRIANITDFLSAVISGNDFTKSKPDPELFLVAAKNIKITPKECLVVEDSYIGILAAKSAKMKTVGVLTSNDKQISKIADLTIRSLKNYNKILDFITKENINKI